MHFEIPLLTLHNTDSKYISDVCGEGDWIRAEFLDEVRW